MSRNSLGRLLALLGLLLLAARPGLPAAAGRRGPAFAPTPAPPAPAGFHLVRTAPGVWLFQKDYPEGNPDFVQRIDLSLGARVTLLHGPITDPGKDQGVYGGDDPRFKSLPLETYWTDFSAAHPSAFCVTNGQFFYMPEEPTRIAFPLKVDGVVLSDGWGLQQYPGKKLMLELWPGWADITELTQASLYNSTAPDIVAGLSEAANKRAKQYVGRTFTGVDDRDGDHWFETVLIFNTLSARQVDAAGVLRSFGADQVMMLDGGGSAQLICADEEYVASDRSIPQALGVTAGPEPTPTPSLKRLERVQALPKLGPGAPGAALSFTSQSPEKDGLSGQAAEARPAGESSLVGALIVLLAMLPLAALVYRTLARLRPPGETGREEGPPRPG